MKQELFNEIKHKYLDKVKKRADEQQIVQNREPNIYNIFDIEDLGFNYFEYIFYGYEINSILMIKEIITNLLKEYNINYLDVSDLTINKNDETEELDSLNRFFIIVNYSNNRSILYVFKKFGIQYNKIKFVTLPEQYKHLEFRYISFVENDPWKEILDYNDDKDDISRGTNIYPISYFFHQHFNNEDYKEFIKCVNSFKNNINDYIGLAITRELKPNVIFDFKNTVEYEIKTHEYDLLVEDAYNNQIGIDEKTKTVINSRFFDSKLYTILLNESDFSKSFITAEWLYQTFKKYGNIDYTSIIMGYLKSIEQFLFKYISLHTYEKDGFKRRILKGYKDNKDYPEKSKNKKRPDFEYNFNDKYLEEHSDSITLGPLTYFISDRKNISLMYTDIQLSDALKYMCSLTYRIKNSDRNKYFHKINLTDPSIVNEVRDDTYMFYYVMLGCYIIQKEDLISIFGFKEEKEIEKLYKYLSIDVLYKHICSARKLKGDYINSPVFYLKKNNTEYGPYSYQRYHDDDVFDRKVFRFVALNYSGNYEIGKAVEKEMNDFDFIVYETNLLINRKNCHDSSIDKNKTLIYDNEHFYNFLSI